MYAGQPPSRRTKIILAVLALVLAGFTFRQLLLAPSAAPYYTFAGRTMGTTYSVKVARRDLSPSEQRALGTDIEAALEHVNALMSTWDPQSEVSRFNASRSTEPQPISPETLEVLRIAARTSELSEGAFDVTVGPLVQAWGFGHGASVSSEPPPPPSSETIARLRQQVGWRGLELGTDPPSVRKSHPATEIDLSAIAKGYGVDEVARTLESHGQVDYLVEVGGELRSSGRKLDGSPWRVAIEQPDSLERSIHVAIALEDRAMATSGDYRNYYEVDGRRLSHTIDPRLARPISHRLASVTVLQPTAVWADALATALDVLGPEAGFALAEERGWPAYFIVRRVDPPSLDSLGGERGEEGGFEVRYTSGFAPLLD